MSFGVLICLLLAHFVADFPLQSKKILNLKKSSDLKQCLLGNTIHAGIYFAVALVSVIYYWSSSILLIVLIISLLHAFIDCIKSFAIYKKPFLNYSTKIFLIDQIIHVLGIWLVFYFVNMKPPVSLSIKTYMNKIVSDFKTMAAGITYNQKLLLSFVLLVIGLWTVGVFIRILFNGMKFKENKGAINLKLEIITFNKKDGADDGGFIIGILERLFIIISIELNMPLVIGFILTAKSVARLKKFDDDLFVEIFIIGSFISFISAIVIGYIIKMLIMVP